MNITITRNQPWNTKGTTSTSPWEYVAQCRGHGIEEVCSPVRMKIHAFSDIGNKWCRKDLRCCIDSNKRIQYSDKSPYGYFGSSCYSLDLFCGKLPYPLHGTTKTYEVARSNN